METPDFIKQIDWKMLCLQKLTLLWVIEYFNSPLTDDLTGILHLIDALQDYAVDKCGIPEETVFKQ